MGMLYYSQPRIYLLIVLLFVVLMELYWTNFLSTGSIQLIEGHFSSPVAATSNDLNISSTAQYFVDFPLNASDYASQFGELGRRVQILKQWITASEANPQDADLNMSIESAIGAMFPFIRSPARTYDTTPLASLRRNYILGSVGIVIPVGTKTFRYACHLVLALRNVHNSKLPIQIAYAGNDDLPPDQRNILQNLAQDIEFLDIPTYLDDHSMQLGKSWAIKPFAVLASTFSQVILMDADAVFLQSPSAILSHPKYMETGTFFFHDRLLYHHGFQERHAWWRKQLQYQEPSQKLLKSLVWTEDYAEEQDSGVVVLDKSRLGVFMGLLHTCWQNTGAVREVSTYNLTWGDKESWWFGMELSGIPYAFADHYGAVLGTEAENAVCGFTIGHLDSDEKLLWWNGSLLKNKAVDNNTFQVPSHWMVDGEWTKGVQKADVSCMRNGTSSILTAPEMEILQKSIELAKRFDADHSLSQ